MQTILNEFCVKNDVREYMMRPLRREGFIYATNGYVAIRVPDDASVDADSHDKMDKLPTAFNVDLDACELSPMPALPELALCRACRGARVLYREACPSCDGNGSFNIGNHDYDCKACYTRGTVEAESVEANKVTCDSCAGTGANGEQTMLIGASTYQLRMVTMVSALPNCMIKMPHSENESLHFRFDGGVGILLSRRT